METGFVTGEEDGMRVRRLSPSLYDLMWDRRRIGRIRAHEARSSEKG